MMKALLALLGMFAYHAFYLFMASWCVACAIDSFKKKRYFWGACDANLALLFICTLIERIFSDCII